MKRFILTILTVFALLLPACTDYKSQVAQLQKEIDSISDNLSVIETVTSNLGGLRRVLALYDSGDNIVSVTPSSGGYDFQFKNNGDVTVGNQTAGVSVGYDGDAFFWTLKGAALPSSTAGKTPVSQSPKFRARDNAPQVSCDGASWADLDVNSAALVSKVEDKAGCIEVTFLGGTVVTFPKEDALRAVFSGDGAQLAATGQLDVDYIVSGGSGPYTIFPGYAAGLSSFVRAETAGKGVISFARQSRVDKFADNVQIYVSDGAGHIISTVLVFASLVPDESLPVMRPVWEAYNIACGGGTVEVELNTNLDYEIVVEEGATWLSRGGSKVVRTDRIAFSAEANESGDMRSALVTFTSGTYTKTVAIYQEGQSQFPGRNLSAGGTANCYIVPSEGDYYFDAGVMGNGQEGIIEGADFHTESAALNPSDVDFLLEDTDEPVIENVRLEDGKIYFHATGRKGNATLLVDNAAGNIIWSWHLWCTDIPLEKTHTNPDGQTFTLLDRNLGATSADPDDGAATFGLYYQWGRKDPFIAQEARYNTLGNSDGNIAYGVSRPYAVLSTTPNYAYSWLRPINNYLWGNPDFRLTHELPDLKKTVYDPCPPGYMVPPANVFAIFRETDRIDWMDNGILLHGGFGQTSFYPYAGRVYANTYDAVGQDTDDYTLALWHSCAAHYWLAHDDGGMMTLLKPKTQEVLLNYGDMRARLVPVRCV